MNNECEELKNIYSNVPRYGYGTINELHSSYMEARNIILRIASRDENHMMQQQLGASSVEIETLIEHARRAKTKKEKEMFFNRASNQLEEDIKNAIGLNKCL